LGTANVETFSWWTPGENAYELRPSDPGRRIWNTRLNEINFLNCIDRTDYSLGNVLVSDVPRRP
jgi:hypothetical protein